MIVARDYQVPAMCVKHGGPMLRYDERTRNGVSAHKARGLCRRCYAQECRAGTLDRWPSLMAGRAIRRQDVAGYVEYLRDCLGLEPEKWVAEMGTTSFALARRLYRAGRPDLARPVERINKQIRKRRRSA